MNIETEDYIVYRKPRWFWQKRIRTWLVVGYYWQPEEAAAARALAEKRARHVAAHLTPSPVETKIHQRHTYPALEDADEAEP